MEIGHKILGSGRRGVLVLHSGFGDHRMYEPMFPYLDTDTYTYAFVDFRGCGLSRSIVGNYSISEIVEDALSLVDYLGWGRFHVVGHAIGGAALFQLATRIEQRVISGVALSPLPPAGFSGCLEMDDALGREFLPNEFRRMIFDITSSGRLSEQWLEWQVLRSWETTLEHAFNSYLTAARGLGNFDEACEITLPLLICIGEHDGAVTPELVQRTYLTWCPNAQLELLNNTGHYPMLELPVLSATLVEQFMRRHG